jgi:hypothetical protein
MVKITALELRKLMENQDIIRNLCVIAHVDHVKKKNNFF